MNTDDLLRKQAAIALHTVLVDNSSFPSCLNCEHYEPTNEFCKQFNSNPPARTIVFSCGVKHYVQKVPF